MHPIYVPFRWLTGAASIQDVFPSLGYSGNRQELSASGYSCPRCKTKTSELPSECVICALPLVRTLGFDCSCLSLGEGASDAQVGTWLLLLGVCFSTRLYEHQMLVVEESAYYDSALSLGKLVTDSKDIRRFISVPPSPCRDLRSIG